MDGYTLRTYTLKGLILQDVAPPLDEISRFNAAGQAEADDMNVSTCDSSCGQRVTWHTALLIVLVRCKSPVSTTEGLCLEELCDFSGRQRAYGLGRTPSYLGLCDAVCW